MKAAVGAVLAANRLRKLLEPGNGKGGSVGLHVRQKREEGTKLRAAAGAEVEQKEATFA